MLEHKTYNRHTSWKLHDQKLIYLRELYYVSHTTGHWLHKIQIWVQTKMNHVTVLNKGKFRRNGSTKNFACYLAVESTLMLSSTYHILLGLKKMEVNGCNKKKQVAQEPNLKDKTQTGKANLMLIKIFMCNLPVYI